MNTTADDAVKRVSELESRLETQREALTKATKSLAELREREVALQLEADVDGIDNTRPLAAVAKAQAEQVASRDRASAAVDELERRITAARAPIEQKEYAGWCAELDALASQAPGLYQRYRAALVALADAAHAMLVQRERVGRLQSEALSYHERRHLPPPRHVAMAPKPVVPRPGWVRRLNGPAHLRAWLEPKERNGEYANLVGK